MDRSPIVNATSRTLKGEQRTVVFCIDCPWRGWIDRLVSLEAMNAHLKFKPKEALRENYSERWLSAK